MSVKILTEDALSLRDQGKHLSALTLLLAAVAASARKCFDHPRRPKKGRPWGEKHDDEAFCAFLGARIRDVLHGRPGLTSDEYGSSGIVFTLDGAKFPIERILYKYYRCELLHEGQLPENAGFSDSGSGLSISSTDTSISFNYGLIDILSTAVIYAPCNATEFGIEHFRLKVKDGVDFEGISDEMELRWTHSKSRIFVFEELMSVLGYENLVNASAESIQSLLKEAVHQKRMNGGMMESMRRRGLAEDDYSLSNSGLAALRHIIQAYEKIKYVF